MRLPFPVVDTNVSYNKYIRSLRTRRKMKCLGSGVFGKVYGSKTGRTVVKVGLIDSDDWGNVDWGNVAYLKYIKHATKNHDNPYFPKVKSVQIFRFNDTYYMAVEMERLQPLTNKEACIADLFSYAVNNRNDVTALGLMIGTKDAVKHLTQMFRVLVYALRKYDLDLHSGNIMRRKNGEIVITDPVA